MTEITVFPSELQKLLKPWLWVLIVSIGVAGFFAFFLAAGRTPVVAEWVGVQDIFNVALVVHVDLSVLLWFLGMTIITWIFWLSEANGWFSSLTLRFSAGCYLLSILCIALAPWHGGAVVKSNYVPMITNALFYTGLSLLMMGTLLAALVVWPQTVQRRKDSLFLPVETLRAGVFGSVTVILMCLWGLAHVYPQIDRGLGDDIFFERLFWAPGHLLQFANTQTLLLVWLGLASAMGLRQFASLHWHRLLLWGNLLIALIGLPVLALESAYEESFIRFFTQHMRWGLGIVPGIVFLLLLRHLPQIWKARKDTAAVALLVSLLVFGAGGLLGWLIHETNTTVPGHYHGSIGGMTAAIMGFIYMLLPRLGYAEVSGWKSARCQLWTYGAGQILHAVGLAWSGGYGALRKTVETDGAVAVTKANIAKGIIGLGGAFAIVGGVLSWWSACVRCGLAKSLKQVLSHWL